MKSHSLICDALAMGCAQNTLAQSTLTSTASTFNPAISLTLDGRYVSYDNDSEYELPGFMLGGEAGRNEQGFQLGHNELSLSGNIDDMFYAKFTAAIAEHEGETEMELEEAVIQTSGLGHGITIKAGRFYSDIGYLNNQHAHAWDFTDAPLVYSALFGNQLIDDGLQFSWIAPTDLFIRLGVETTRGERFPAGGASNDGRGAQSVFAEFGGDVGISHAWQLGFSHWRADIEDRQAGGHAHDETVTETPSFSGDSEISAIDMVWKWAPDGNKRERNLTLQGEYFTRDEDGEINMLGSDPLESSSYQGEQKGWYLQGVYQFKPRWRIGYRHDQLQADNRGDDADVLAEAGLDDEDHTPKRATLMLDYSHSEYSRIRLQYAKDDSYEDSDSIVYLQYIVSLGAHGAHRF
jgi:hypothetical protein